MKFTLAFAAAALLAGSFTLSTANAATSLFATEPAAQQACQADEVVWVDLDRGRFYHKSQSAFAKSSNGGYACLKAAHAQYREAHD
jgi:hypothetical protein